MHNPTLLAVLTVTLIGTAAAPGFGQEERIEIEAAMREFNARYHMMVRFDDDADSDGTLDQYDTDTDDDGNVDMQDVTLPPEPSPT